MSSAKGAMEKGYNRWMGGVSRAFYGKKPRERFLIILSFLINLLLAVMFSKCTLPLTEKSVGVPLADALLCASGNALGAYMGALYGAFLTKSISFSRCFTLTAIFVLRAAISVWGFGEKGEKRGVGGRIFHEPIFVKVGVSGLTVILQSLFHLSECGIYDGVWMALLATLIPLPVLTAVFSVFFAGCPKKHVAENGYIMRALYEVSVLCFFAAIVFSFKDARYFGVSLSSLLALILTLLCAHKGGFLRGAFAGGVLGLIHSPALLASFAVFGAAAGIFYCIGVLPAAGISAFFGSGTALMQIGFSAFAGFIPEIIFAVAIASPLLRYAFIPERFPYPREELLQEYEGVDEAEKRALRNAENNGDIIKLSDTLLEISDALSGEGESLENREARAVSFGLCTRFCDTCALNMICWESERARSEGSVKGIINAIKNGEALPHDRKTNYLSGYCIKFKELCEEIKALSEGGALSEERKTPGYELTASDFKRIAEILSDMVNKSRLEGARDENAERAIVGLAGRIGFKAKSVSVLGTERKRIYAYGVKEKGSDEEKERIRRAFSEVCKTEYGTPFFSEELQDCMMLLPEKTLSVKPYFLKSTKAGEVCSGDSVHTVEIGDGYFYALLTDGMGSGEEARLCSESAISLLEKLLSCRVKKSTATALVGDILKRRGGECFTTVDIMELDLVNGNASFLKSGAAASYVVRNGGVYCINACSMPVGILGDTCPEEISFKLQKGDTVIMLSDGIASDSVDGKWISETVAAGFSSVEELAAEIMKRADKKSSQNDDKTVLIMQLDDAITSAEAKEA